MEGLSPIFPPRMDESDLTEPLLFLSSSLPLPIRIWMVDFDEKSTTNLFLLTEYHVVLFFTLKGTK